MNTQALQDCLARHHAHAALTFTLDEELGTQHGLAWSDFVLLEAIDAAGGALATTQLAQRLGLRPSPLLLRLLPLEKIGLVARNAHAAGARQVALRPSGRQLLREARETAAAVCGARAPA